MSNDRGQATIHLTLLYILRSEQNETQISFEIEGIGRWQSNGECSFPEVGFCFGNVAIQS